jgi:chloride channel 3/4/5
MAPDEEIDEQTHLLDAGIAKLSARQGSHEADRIQTELFGSIISSHLPKEEQLLVHTAIGERLPYNDYTTIDWLHDLVLLCLKLSCNCFANFS